MNKLEITIDLNKEMDLGALARGFRKSCKVGKFWIINSDYKKAIIEDENDNQIGEFDLIDGEGCFISGYAVFTIFLSTINK